MRTAVRTHIGKVRQVNEDKAWSGTLAGGATAVIVADGMGGHRAGDVASGLAVDSLTASLQAWDAESADKDEAAALGDMIRKANAVVYETASLNEQYHNMGTTVVLALLAGNSGWIGHIGDSRAYRLRAGKLGQLTDDHTLVNELTKSGQISAEEAAHHPRRNVLTRALGTDLDVVPDVVRIDWQPGDRLLVCSDGLSGLVEFETLQAVLSEPGASAERTAERLVELALDAGGDDNVTVAVIEDEAGTDAAEGGAA